MKSIFKRTIKSETAMSLVEGIVSQCRELALAYEDDQDPYTEAGWNNGKFIFCPDYWSGQNTVDFPASNTIRVLGETTHGSFQLIVSLSGTITAIHDGYRNSYPGNALQLLPSCWEELNHINGWSIIRVETSQPGWAVTNGWLVGKLGSGPINLCEQNELICKRYIATCRKVGYRDIPESLYFEGGKFWTDGFREWKPSFEGIHYRRAAANGINL